MALPVPVPSPTPAEEARFWSKVRKGDGDDCWEWVGGKFAAGYGCFALRGRPRRAHRVLYVWTFGELALGVDQLDHLCENRACVRPDHLRPSTALENVLRSKSVTAVNAKKTHCDNGHEFTPENTILDNRGWRQCRECGRRAAREYQRRRRAGKIPPA